MYVIGGGFSGLEAVRALMRRANGSEIRLIDRTGRATMIPALPDALSGRITRSALWRPLEEVVDPRVEVIRDDVERVDLENSTIEGEQGTYEYDGLVIAAGSIPNPPPGPLKGAPLFHAATYDGVERLRAELERRLAEHQGPDSGDAVPHLVVAGGGYTGLEVAIAARSGAHQGGARIDVTVADAADDILPMVTDSERAYIRSFLAEQGIALKTGTLVSSVTDRQVELSDGTRIPNAVTCWAAGMRSSPLGLDDVVETTRDKRIYTNAYLQLDRAPNVFVAGDAAALNDAGTVLRRAVNFSYYSGRRAGANLAAYLFGEPMKAWKPVDLGWVIPLGDISVGRVFGRVPVAGKVGLRMHYTMCGVRHFGGGRSPEFFRTALSLGRYPDKLGAHGDSQGDDARPGFGGTR